MPNQFDQFDEQKKPNPFDQFDNPEEFDFSAWQAVKNFPGSFAHLVGTAAHAVMNPIDTSKALGQVAQGVGNKIGRNAAEFVQGKEMEPMPEHSEAAANMVGRFYKDRYGSLEAVKRTIQNDPAGAMLDVSALGSLGKVPGLAQAAKYTDPLNAAARATQAASKVIIRPGFAEKLYESAVKFGTTIPKANREKMVATALDHGFMPTQRGVRKVDSRIAALGETLDDMIIESGKAGTKIPVESVYRYLGELKKSKRGTIGAKKDIATIKKIEADFRAHITELGKEMGGRIKAVTPDQLQYFKQQAYKDVSYKPGRKPVTRPKEQTYKAMARGAKDAVADAVPEVSEINKLLGEVLELQPELARAANRIENRNLIGLDTSVKVGAGIAGGAAADATGFGAALGMAASLLGNPKIKPRIAFALKKLRDGDVAWIDQRLGDPAVRAAIVLAGRAEEIVGVDNSDLE